MGNRNKGTQQVKYVGNTGVFCFGYIFMSPKWTRTKLISDVTPYQEAKWLVLRRAAQVTMSNPGSSWLSIPVTETFLPVLSNILTSDPGRPPLAPLSIRDP